MLIKRLVISLLLVLFAHAPVSAQSAAQDGANLPATDLKRVKVGEPAADFTLEDAEGKKISLSDFRGKKSVVLVFYRGYW
jgi:cytochrome oxidase Cu insertion factor (SCO1/SenC/PrrC family)